MLNTPIPQILQKKKRGNPEDDLCASLVEYLQYKRLRYNHSPNEIHRGGKGGIIQGARNKRIWVSAGFPDYVIFLPGDADLYLEVKTSTGKLKPEQKEWIRYLNEETKNYAEVAYSLKEAIAIIEKYLKK